MNILTKTKTIVNPPCHQCAGTTTGSTQHGQPICNPCAMKVATALLQYGGPAGNQYPAYTSRTNRTEFLVLAGGAL